MDHRALLRMKDPEEPQLWQACPLCRISWRTHPACPAETYMPVTKLPVLLLCGGLNATGFHRPRALASRAGGTSDRKSTRLNSSHANISYAVFCLKKKKKTTVKYETKQNRISKRLLDIIRSSR